MNIHFPSLQKSIRFKLWAIFHGHKATFVSSDRRTINLVTTK